MCPLFIVHDSVYLSMETMKVDILHPKAAKLLKDLADMKLISIQDNADNPFLKVVKRLRNKNKQRISLEEITKEVATVRAKRYGK